jgi:cytochrome c peroxidase
LALSLSALAVAGCGAIDDAFCPNGNCGWPADEAARVAALSALPETPPVDTSNKYSGNAAAEQLGRQFFWDTRFSGNSTGLDSIKRPVAYSRAPKGQPINVSCQSCHDFNRGGADPATIPGNVSVGASWDNTNAGTMFNDAYRPLVLWAGRADSLWSQVPGALENAMASNRLRAAWIIASYYRADYETVFADYPLPMTGALTDITPTLETTAPLTGQCKLSGGACPAGCRSVADSASSATGCFPRFPVDGKPGSKMGCQPGDTTEPFGDAWDCMDPQDQPLVVRVMVNFSKALAAFEAKLTTRNSAFDKFAADLREGHAAESTAISPEAKNGARLFVGKAGCSDCHNGALLTDENFYNVGIPQVGDGVPRMTDCPKGGVCDCVTPNNCIPFGAYDGYQKLHANAYLRTSAWSDNPQDDSRAMYMNMDRETIPKGSWRTPSLRDVALTAPYMHDGAMATLEDVVDHYNKGASAMANGTPSARIQPLFLSIEEENQLVAFLKTLTGEPLPPELSSPPTLP